MRAGAAHAWAGPSLTRSRKSPVGEGLAQDWAAPSPAWAGRSLAGDGTAQAWAGPAPSWGAPIPAWARAAQSWAHGAQDWADRAQDWGVPRPAGRVPKFEKAEPRPGRARPQSGWAETSERTATNTESESHLSLPATHLAPSPVLAPQGATACSLGREPQVPTVQKNPEPRRGDGSLHRNDELPSPLRGSGLALDRSFLGLAPQATCLDSFGVPWRPLCL